MKKGFSLYRGIRVLHRDIGFFVVGLTVIYCISGIMLTYRESGFLKSETEIERTIAPGLQANELGRALHLKDIRVLGEDDRQVRFSAGVYDKQTGIAHYVSSELPAVLRAFNGLHVTSGKDSRSLFTICYALLLLFLALSSFWMYRPGTGLFKRAIAISCTGLLASIILLAV